MKERYIVTVHPEPGRAVPRTFERKGLAFAYVKRKLPLNAEPAITIAHQRLDTDGGSWIGLNAWTYYTNGEIDHVRL